MTSDKLIFRLKLIVTNILWIIFAGWIFLYSDWLRQNIGAIVAVPIILSVLLVIQFALWRDEWRGIQWQLTRVDNRQESLHQQQNTELHDGLQQIRGKQGALTQALKNLSDDELIRLKAGLEDGTIDDAMLYNEIEKQKRS